MAGCWHILTGLHSIKFCNFNLCVSYISRVLNFTFFFKMVKFSENKVTLRI